MENKQMSLRECAMHDAKLYHGNGAVEELKAKWRRRKANKRPGVKTNVSDPIHNRKR